MSTIDVPELKSIFESSYEKLLKYASFLAKIYGLCKEDAEDCVEDAFVKLSENISKVEDAFVDASKNKSKIDMNDLYRWIHKWLRTVVKRCLINKAKKKVKIAISQIMPSTDQTFIRDNKTVDPLSALIKEEEIQKLRECISLLLVTSREVLVLKYILEMSYDEICMLLQIFKSTARARVCRAAKLLKECLKSKGITE